MTSKYDNDAVDQSAKAETPDVHAKPAVSQSDVEDPAADAEFPSEVVDAPNPFSYLPEAEKTEDREPPNPFGYIHMKPVDSNA